MFHCSLSGSLSHHIKRVTASKLEGLSVRGAAWETWEIFISPLTALNKWCNEPQLIRSDKWASAVWCLQDTTAVCYMKLDFFRLDFKFTREHACYACSSTDAALSIKTNSNSQTLTSHLKSSTVSIKVTPAGINQSVCSSQDGGHGLLCFLGGWKD